VRHGKEIVPKAGYGDLVRTNTAAGDRVTFEHADVLALAHQHRRTDERIDAAPDDHDVERVHQRLAITRRPEAPRAVTRGSTRACHADCGRTRSLPLGRPPAAGTRTPRS